jgi:hypothetical protein
VFRARFGAFFLESRSLVHTIRGNESWFFSGGKQDHTVQAVQISRIDRALTHLANDEFPAELHLRRRNHFKGTLKKRFMQTPKFPRNKNLEILQNFEVHD